MSSFHRWLHWRASQPARGRGQDPGEVLHRPPRTFWGSHEVARELDPVLGTWRKYYYHEFSGEAFKTNFPWCVKVWMCVLSLSEKGQRSWKVQQPRWEPSERREAENWPAEKFAQGEDTFKCVLLWVTVSGNSKERKTSQIRLMNNETDEHKENLMWGEWKQLR